MNDLIKSACKTLFEACKHSNEDIQNDITFISNILNELGVPHSFDDDSDIMIFAEENREDDNY